MNKLKLVAVLICVLVPATMCFARSSSENVVLVPTEAQLPAWLERGKIRFARFDGGPIEVQKATRSSWGEGFTPQEDDVLGNLYGKYGDRMVALLKQAHVNFVWVTYSVGFSWQDEAAQRAAVREVVRKLHAHGIHVAGYMCAISVFWQSMFKDVPQSVRWIMFDPQGIPYRYSGGRDALRFIADVRNPGWINYQEQRVGGIIDDGLDAIFFDNTTGNPGSIADFFIHIRQFIHDKKHSNIPLFANFGLSPSLTALNRYMNFTFDESWQEPGVWGTEWNVSNMRRDRLLQGMLPSWKPRITEYSIFHQGDRSSTFLSAHSEGLSIAESAAFGTAYSWDMEGPFDGALIAHDPKALETWSAIGQYNGFLKDHPPFYDGATNVTPLLVIIPDNYKIGFDWTESSTTPFFDALSKHSVLYSVAPARDLTEKKVESYSGVVIPFFSALTSDQKQLVRNYQAGGGKVYAFARASDLDGFKCEVSSPALLDRLIDDAAAQREILDKLASLAPEATRITVSGAPHVLANVTTADQRKTIVIHLLNYSPQSVHHVHFSLHLGGPFGALIGKQPTLASPDLQTSRSLKSVRWTGATMEASLPTLRTYAVVLLH